MKIGLCTGGGDCPGLNAVLRAVVKRAINGHGMRVFGIHDSFNGLMQRPFGVEEIFVKDVDDLLSRGGTFLGTTNKGNPFKIQSRDHSQTCDQSQLVLEAYNQLKLDGIIVVGGDGTQSIAHQLSTLGIRVVGIPKTIDNDLAETDETVGFATAVDIAADAIARLQTTAESHDRIMVLEVMGRDAGHIALHSGIAGGASIILIPEIPFDYKSLVAKIEERRQRGLHYTTVVVSEGAFEKDGEQVTFTSATSSNTSTHLGGIGAVVAKRLHDLSGCDARFTVLGHVQRGGSPNHYDRVLASGFGVFAVDALAAKKFNQVVVRQGGRYVTVDYAKVSGKARPVSLESDFVRTAEGLGICLGR